MTLAEVQEMLEESKLPVAYHSFTEEFVEEHSVTLPYVVWFNPSDVAFGADNKTYYSHHAIRVELYERSRNATTEAAVEAVLKDLYYTKEEVYIDDEAIYEIIYQFEV